MGRRSIQILTVITPSYERVGREMVKRVKRFTGHDLKVIETSDDKGFEAKLNLDREAGRRKSIWMDCDLWPIREWNPEEVHLGSCFQACWDHAVLNPMAFPNTDCQNHGLVWDRYFNSGLMLWDNGNPDHREIFRLSRQSWRDQKNKKKDYTDVTDQAHVNFGLLQSNVPLQFLPEVMNCYLFGIFHGQRPYIPRDIINLHGAGIKPKKKFGELKAQARTLGQACYPMHQDAINLEYTKLFSMR